jgi:retinol dehydrogenase 12
MILKFVSLTNLVKKPDITVTNLGPYQNSKLANVIHARKLAKQLEGTGVTAYSLHPGVVATDIWRLSHVNCRTVPWPFQSLIKMMMLSEEQGIHKTD